MSTDMTRPSGAISPCRSHASSVPPVAREYFGGGHPVIREVFWPARGWRAAPWAGPKFVSISALRRLRAQGATAVQLGDGLRCPDFLIDELLRRPVNVPLLGGSLIGSKTRNKS